MTVTPTEDSVADDRVRAFLDGDPVALERVRRWVRGASTPYRRRLALELEDVEQEVLVDLAEALREGRFRGEASLSTYVRRMTHFKCLNRVRAASHRLRAELDDVVASRLEDSAASPFRRTADREAVALALRVVAEMPESCRRLWAMIHDGQSYAEMSERLGVAAGTLRVRVLRCRQKALVVRDRLRGDG